MIGKSKTSKFISFLLVFILVFGSILPNEIYAEDGLQVTTGYTKNELVNKIIGKGIKNISNINWSGESSQFGMFSGGKDIIGFEEGIILSTGDATDVIGPNNNDGITKNKSSLGDEDLDAISGKYRTEDAAVLEFDFELEDPEEEYISFQYVFSSDEYNEYVNSKFNDVFALFINGDNAALIPNTNTPVAINNVNGGNPYDTNATNPKYFRNNDPNDGGVSINTQMDGLTVVMSVSYSIKKGINHIKLAIADVSDGSYDSNVFIKRMSVKSGKAKHGKIGFDSNDGYEVTVIRTDGSDSSVSADWTAKDKDGKELDSKTVFLGDEETKEIITVPNGTKTVELSNPTNGAVIDYEKTSITIIHNHVPKAVDDTVTTKEDTAKEIDVLINDTDPEDNIDATKVELKKKPSRGSVSVDKTTGKITYTPNGDYNGEDSFTYTVKDKDSAESNEATVTITVKEVNDEPVAIDDSVVIDEDKIVTIDVLKNDYDADEDEIKITFLTQPDYGSVYETVYGTVYNKFPYEEIIYVPNHNFNGVDHFEYEISDGNGGKDKGIVNILVGVSNDAPKASDDKVSTWVNTKVTKTIIAKDVDGDELTYSIHTKPSNGSAIIDKNTGKWTYNPNTGFYGQDSFNVKIDDGNGGTKRIKININVRKGNITLNGQITDKENGKPISDAEVILYDLSGKKLKRYKTNGDGKYSITDFSENTYMLMVTHNQYSKNQRMVDLSSTNKELKNGKIVEDFELVNFTIDLEANPSTIVGNGKSQTLLTSQIKDKNGKPIQSVKIKFHAPRGSFPNGIIGVTDENGRVTIPYKSEKIEGIESKMIPVTAFVKDEKRGLFDFAQIQITFQPSAIKGIVVDQKTGIPIPNAKVKIKKDFDEDGIVDFYGIQITDSDGNYKIAVPKGNESYDIDISVPTDIGEVTYKQEGYVGEITGTGNEDYEARKTATGIIVSQDSSGNKRLLDKKDYKKMKLELSDKNGNKVGEGVITDKGIFKADNLKKDKEYEFKVKYELDEGIEITIGKLNVHVNADGEVLISEVLIDPYGTITDLTNGNIIAGAKVDLYYADTQRNRDNGKTPHTIVNLPIVDNFPPADNRPHSSDENGKYAYMVFPHTDYYLIGTKSGYYQYTSPIIPVETTIVRHDIKMQPIKSKQSKSDSHSSRKVKNDLAVVIETDRVKVEENDIVTFKINYYNKSNVDAENVTIDLNIPGGVSIYDKGNGSVSNDTIEWKLPNIDKNANGQLIVKFKIDLMNKGESILSFDANISSNGHTTNNTDDKSTMKLFIYSNESEHLHKRYVGGYPDGEFKAKRNITRAEIAAIFARILNLKKIESNTKTYKDVELGHWASGHIKAVTDRNLLIGYGNAEFRPDQAITRGELATVVANYLGISKDGVEPMNMHFSDIEKNWAIQNIEEIYRFKIINGYEDGTFKPNQYITRTEAVVMINKLLYRGPVMNIEPYFSDITKKHWAFGHIQEAGIKHECIINKDGSEKSTKVIQEPLW